jgi:hypothetical protein
MTDWKTSLLGNPHSRLCRFGLASSYAADEHWVQLAYAMSGSVFIGHGKETIMDSRETLINLHRPAQIGVFRRDGTERFGRKRQAQSREPASPLLLAGGNRSRPTL